MRRGCHAPRGLLGCVVAVAAGAVAACDVPTSPPEWETTWVVPGDSIRLAVASLLPSAVTVNEDSSAFVLALDGTDFPQTLGELCAACQTLDGTTAPKPAFTSSFSSSVDLPFDVVVASLAAGSMRLRLTNGFNFDPVRPGGAEQGIIRVTILHGTAVVAADSVDGRLESFAPGTVKELDLGVSPVVLLGPVQVDVEMISPAGAAVAIDASQVLGAELLPGTLEVSEVQITVSDKSVDIDGASMDLTDVDEAAIDRLRSGAFRLGIQNPFTVEGELDLRIVAPGTELTRTVPIALGESEPRVAFTGDEIRAILGNEVEVGGTATVSAPSGVLTVTPSQVLVVDAALEVVVVPLEGEDDA